MLTPRPSSRPPHPSPLPLLRAGIAGAVVLPVAGVVGGAVQVGRGLANQGEAIREKKKGRVWNKVSHAFAHSAAGLCLLHAGTQPLAHAQQHVLAAPLTLRPPAPQETHEWVDPPGQELAAYDADAAAAALGIKPDVDYYALLEVTRDADVATIKRQYYVLARKWHPGARRRRAQARGVVGGRRRQ